MWDTEPQRVLKTLLKPTAKVPTNQVEHSGSPIVLESAPFSHLIYACDAAMGTGSFLVICSLLPHPACVLMQWETFFMALSVGDALGVWFAISSPALKGAAILFTDFFVFDLIRGKGLQVQ